LAIAFLEDTRRLAIRSGEEKYVQSTQPASRPDGEVGAEKHPQDQAAGNEANLQHHQPRSTRSCEAALWDEEVLAVLLTAQLRTPCTRRKAQPGPAGSKPSGVTGPLPNSLRSSTELQCWGCLCRDTPEPLSRKGFLQLSHPKAPQSPGHFWRPAQPAGKKQLFFWGRQASPRCARAEERSSRAGQLEKACISSP